MKLQTLRRHISPYLIHAKRATTINHAFSSALAPVGEWDPVEAKRAMTALGQGNFDALVCVYCAGPGQTWDHLEPLVRNSEPSGFGHTLGNLVPCCRDCNSAKGNKPWREWLSSWPKAPESAIISIDRYVATFRPSPQVMSDLESKYPEELRELRKLWHQILDLMKSADVVVERMKES